MIHTIFTRNCLVFLLPRRLTRSAIYGSQIFDSHKWPTVENQAISRLICVDHCILLLNHLSNHKYAFYNKRLQTLFKDQLDRSKATCCFKDTGHNW